MNTDSGSWMHTATETRILQIIIGANSHNPRGLSPLCDILYLASSSASGTLRAHAVQNTHFIIVLTANPASSPVSVSSLQENEESVMSTIVMKESSHNCGGSLHCAE